MFGNTSSNEIIELDSAMRPTPPQSSFTQAQIDGLHEYVEAFSRQNMLTSSGDFSWSYEDVYSHREVVQREEKRRRSSICHYFQPARIPSQREISVIALRRRLRQQWLSGKNLNIGRRENSIGRNGRL